MSFFLTTSSVPAISPHDRVIPLSESVSVSASQFTCSSLSVGGSSVATKSDLSSYAKTSALSDYVKKKNNGFSQATSPSSMMCIVDGTIKYIVRSDLKSWLGIS